MRVFSAEEGCAKKKSKRLFILLPKVKTENTLTARITVQLVSSVTALDLTQQESVMLYVQTVITESKTFRMETSCTVILPPECSLARGELFLEICVCI